ncbi:MAG: hypothetical protein DRO98_05985 [Archaeoglobales archaeon]|nr:MAG: hypothetical protein DRO98_05985 [Archaeoglobales archaeon]
MLKEVRKLIPLPILLAAISAIACILIIECVGGVERTILALIILTLLFISAIYSSSIPFVDVFSLEKQVSKKRQRVFRVLVGTDGSELAKKAVEYAAGLAMQNKGEVLLLHVIGVEPKIPPSIWTTSEVERRDREYLEKLRVAGESLLKEESNRIALTGVKVSTRIEFGDPAEKILEVAERENVDMIVLGVRGTSKWKRLLLGSVSEKVIENARVPVLIVR